jgi:hypothetical protein
MERVWLFDKLAVAVMRIDFLDPALSHLPDVRERGVRLELRPTDQSKTAATGSVYASPTVSLGPALCRVDLLESRPGACDRMHWHPTMSDGEPGDRVFDETIPDDPTGWVAARLRAADSLLPAEMRGDASYGADVDSIAAAADEIVGVVLDGLAWARRPWPEVEHDERGMAIGSR